VEKREDAEMMGEREIGAKAVVPGAEAAAIRKAAVVENLMVAFAFVVPDGGHVPNLHFEVERIF
jgi:hypothetical protein